MNEIIEERTNAQFGKEKSFLTVSKRRELELRQVSKELGFNDLCVVKDSAFSNIRARQLEVHKAFLERNLKQQMKKRFHQAIQPQKKFDKNAPSINNFTTTEQLN